MLMVSCTNTPTETYVCPMHPEVTSNKAGDTCPKCKMMLVLKAAEQKTETLDSISVDDLLEPTNEKVLASVVLTKPAQKSLPSIIKCNGVIAYDPHTYRAITSLFSGRIERLYVKYPLQAIKKGDKLFDVYSPEMLTEQQNLIFMLNSKPIDQQLVDATKQKLGLLGMDAKQISEVERTRTAKKLFSVYSPYTGYLLGNENTTEQSTSKSGMGESQSKASIAQNFSFKEGAYIEKGQTIFSMANNNKVWAILKVYEKDIQSITSHLKAEIYTEDPHSDVFKGQVDFVEPFNGANTKMFNVRVYLNNENQKLKIGQLVNASITSKSQSGWWIPKTAVIDMGMSKLVFMKENQVFHAMSVITGAELGKWVQVISGLEKDANIASDAHYLIDSESFITHKRHAM